MKYRKSESNTKPKLVEYLQDGILIRFDIKEVEREEQTMYVYKEFWFELGATNIKEMVASEGFNLTKKYTELLK